MSLRVRLDLTPRVAAVCCVRGNDTTYRERYHVCVRARIDVWVSCPAWSIFCFSGIRIFRQSLKVYAKRPIDRCGLLPMFFKSRITRGLPSSYSTFGPVENSRLNAGATDRLRPEPTVMIPTKCFRFLRLRGRSAEVSMVQLLQRSRASARSKKIC